MINLVEYSAGAAKLAKEDLAYLLGLVKAAKVDEPTIFQAITPTQAEGIFELTPGPFVGRLGLPSGETIDIQSRFSFPDVLSLVSFSGRLPALLESRAAQNLGDRFLVDLIAEAFAREVNGIVGKGLAKGYVTRRFLAPPYPGRLDVIYHLNHLQGRPDRLATSARRLTVDIKINQAIKAALGVLQRARYSHVEIGSMVARLSAALGPVGNLPISAAEVRSIRPTRLQSSYSEALPLAALVLEGNSLAPKGGGLAGASILFSMPRIWEDCVERWARGVWGPEFRVEKQHNFDLSKGGEMTSSADVVVWEGNRIRALYDAKYKMPKGTPSTGDVYQMVTYCERLGLDEATLVYPAAIEPRGFCVGGRTVRMLGLRQVLGEEEAELVAVTA